MRSILELARPGLIEGQNEGECVLLGDLNTDDVVNIQDVIIMINIVLGIMESIYCADYNLDGVTNIQDIIFIVNDILR